MTVLRSFWTMGAVCAATALLAACGGSDDNNGERSVGSLRLIGQQILPRRMEYQGTVVGGISGIDYDEKSNQFVLLSDDRTTTDSANAPRMYTVRLNYDASSFSGVPRRRAILAAAMTACALGHDPSQPTTTGPA